MVFGEIMALLVGTSYFIFRVTFQCLAPLSKKSQMFIWLQTIEINTVPFLSRKHHVYRQEPIRRVRSKTKYVLGINFFAFSTLAIIAVQLVVRETDRLGAGNSWHKAYYLKPLVIDYVAGWLLLFLLFFCFLALETHLGAILRTWCSQFTPADRSQELSKLADLQMNLKGKVRSSMVSNLGSWAL